MEINCTLLPVPSWGFLLFMVNLFLSLFSPKAIESSLVAKWEQSHLSLIQPYLVMNVCVSGYVGAAPRPPAPPTVPGQNSTAKEHSWHYHWPRLIGALWSESRSHVPASRTTIQPQSEPLLHHVSEENYHWILSGLKIFEYFFPLSNKKEDHCTQCKAKWALDQSHDVL